MSKVSHSHAVLLEQLGDAVVSKLLGEALGYDPVVISDVWVGSVR